jgi:hypothetical protein
VYYRFFNHWGEDDVLPLASLGDAPHDFSRKVGQWMYCLLEHFAMRFIGPP